MLYSLELYSLPRGSDQTLSGATALALLTALNLLNYIDRSVLFAVQDLVKADFIAANTAFGLLNPVFFFVFYMCAAPFMGPLSVRFFAEARHRCRRLDLERRHTPYRGYDKLQPTAHPPYSGGHRPKPALSFFLQPL